MSGSHLRLVVDSDGTIDGPLELDSDSTVTHTGTFKDVKLGDGVLVTGAGAKFLGTTEIAGGELRLETPVTMTGLKQTGGEITGTVTVTGQFAWTDGDQGRPGRDRAGGGRHRRHQ